MMDDAGTVKMAIDLMHFPSQVRRMRSAPLPNAVLTLLRIVAGDQEATSQTAETMGRSCETIREAAAFFIEQILLHPDADSYRVLGATPEATNEELRHNMALLLRWLHPDHDGQGERSVFAGRVTRAWNDLKTQERRAAYDKSRRRALTEKSLLRKKGGTHSMNRASPRHLHNNAPYRSHAGPRRYFNPKRLGLLHRVLLLLLGKVVH
jgi:hypothetical protein